MSIYREPEKLCSCIENWIKERFVITGSSGAVLGISGGIDSAVLAGLLSRVLGPQNVIGVIMPCHSMPIDEEYARILAGKFKIRVERVDLTDSFDLLKSTLDKEVGVLNTLPEANIKPRLRMITLYAIAQQNSYIVCGGSNKDEIMYGYFTKYGDSGVDMMPMADLLKGEVRLLAEYMGVPREIIDRAPTAGLWDGQTDESEMGLSYDTLDRFLATGEADTNSKAKITKAISRSEHKRKFAMIAELPKNL